MLALSVKIVKRPFKSNGVFYAAGSVITDPAEIRLYKTKVKDGRIIDVYEQDVDDISEYFLSKMGVDIKESLLKAFADQRAEEEAAKKATEEEAARIAAEEATEEAERLKAEAAKKVAEEAIKPKAQTPPPATPEKK